MSIATKAIRRTKASLPTPPPPTPSNLLVDGFKVMRVPDEMVSCFDRTTFLSEQREFLDSRTPKVLGGFGAFGNPSSFHHPQLRTLRHSLWQWLETKMSRLFPGNFIHFIADRFSERVPDSSLSAESWHRDVSVPPGSSLLGVYGGWLNLDSACTQYFTCVPRSHSSATGEERGFDKFSKEECAELQKKKVRIAIPPGHILIFNEKLAHCITATKTKFHSYRLYNKFAISTSPVWIFGKEQTMQWLDTQASLPLHVDSKGDFTFPPMYAKLHAVNWVDRLDTFSETLRPEFRDRNTGRVLRFLPSLESVQLKFHDYTVDEKEMFVPRQLHLI